MTDTFIMTTQSADRIGIVAALSGCLAAHEGFVHELAQFGTPSSERFYSRICFSMPAGQQADFRKALAKIGAELSLRTDISPSTQKMRTLLMVSKHDHCLADILYRWRTGVLNIDVAGIVSNHETHADYAARDDLPFFHIPVTKETKAAAEATLRRVIEDTGSDLIVLARYMQILSDDFCSDYPGRIINIHHSFLPSFKGAKPYHRAYARGVKLIGATAHYVTADLDEGQIIEQSVLRVDHTNTPKQLIALGRDVEARTLAAAIRLHSEHRVFINGPKTVVLP